MRAVGVRSRGSALHFGKGKAALDPGKLDPVHLDPGINEEIEFGGSRWLEL